EEIKSSPGTGPGANRWNMLDVETKRKIDNCRDILVGKIPDPKSQVEQITIALIYKFMDDMDRESIEMGGKSGFFKGEYKKYSWTNIFDPRIGGHDLINIYSEALDRMNQNPNIPQLFRDIFKNAFLPYRDPETLRIFLKEINNFRYDHSEKLGDAFEYLLSVLSSQGDAGQFRTPRHIIDFIVEVIEPRKNDMVLDPACGTAGFLISAYKHIVRNNQKLNPDEKKRILNNFVGYDISPDMVRLSLVNMYLHGFKDPKIHEYDTLTSEDKWGETFDVIMANPPFMSPKGGIRPHSKFAISANRSEVLFVDYIAEHLNPQGRAGVIVPEGIIFQSSNAYKALRKMLVENYLWAVVSLPAGIFNPYSGVKTSILLMDKSLAKRIDKILFVKVENDGFDLGAQRREIDKNDMPAALKFLKIYKSKAENYKDCLAPAPVAGDFAHAVSKSEIAKSGDYNLTGERYIKFEHNAKIQWPMVELGEICLNILSGGTPSTKVPEYWNGNIPWITSADILDLKNAQPRKYITKEAIKESATNLIPKTNIIVVTRVGLGKLFLNNFDVCISQDSQGLIINKEKILPDFLLYILFTKVQQFKNNSRGSTIQGVTKEQLSSLKIPLPSLDIQEKIVSEIEDFQKIIDGARQIVENYKPTIKIKPDWPMVKLCEACDVKPPKSELNGCDKDMAVSFVPMADLNENLIAFIPNKEKKIKEVINVYTYFKDNDVLLAKITPCFENGKSGIARNLKNGIGFGSTEFIVLRATKDILPEWIYYFVSEKNFLNQGENNMSGSAGQQRITTDFVNNYEIPLPTLNEQKQIVAEIEEERAIVNENKKLIEIFEKKIKDKIAEVWGESPS
ncbi:MAG: N-6 DNA methylase, partial [Sedimentisphaerales bacterium]